MFAIVVDGDSKEYKEVERKINNYFEEQKTQQNSKQYEDEIKLIMEQCNLQTNEINTKIVKECFKKYKYDVVNTIMDLI